MAILWINYVDNYYSIIVLTINSRQKVPVSLLCATCSAAGIVDEDGSLMAIYTDGSERIAPLAFTRP